MLQKNPIESEKYQRGYNLVPEKISQSAPIKIYLPKGVDKETAKNNISFDPVIEGDWMSEKSNHF